MRGYGKELLMVQHRGNREVMFNLKHKGSVGFQDQVGNDSVH